MVVTTINKTQLSYLLAIVAAEYVLGLVPQGTHEWEKFVEPKKLKSVSHSSNTQHQAIHYSTTISHSAVLRRELAVFLVLMSCLDPACDTSSLS